MTPVDTRVEERDRIEISSSVAELQRARPELDVDFIEGLVYTAHHELMPAKLHHYAAILIVHQVRGIISSRRAAA